MPALRVVLALHHDAPRAAYRRDATTLCTPFGRWMRERVASAMIDWPGITIAHLRLTPARCTVVLWSNNEAEAPTRMQRTAEALRCELETAAGRVGWVKRGDPLWRRRARSLANPHPSPLTTAA